MTKPTKIAVVGAGKWGQNLIKTLSDLKVLTAIVEIDELRGQSLAKSYGVAYYSNLQQGLDHVDAVVIATPVPTHYELTKQVLLAGKDVFVEKPLAMSVAEADSLLTLACQQQAILMVGHLLLYQPCIQFIKAFLASGQLGKVYSFRQTRRNLGTIRREENVLYSLGVHDLAVLQHLIAEPVSAVLASSQTIITEGIADDMTIHLHYSSGVQAHLHLSWLWPVKDRQLMILGEKGALHFDELAGEVTYYQHYGNSDSSITKKGVEVLFSDSTPPLALELLHFLKCIQTREQPLSSGQQGKEVVELMEKIMKVKAYAYDDPVYSS
jgi:predicted dehydrogenase